MTVGDLAEQLMRLLLPANGVLRRSAALDRTLRAATVSDLFLAGRITDDADGAWVLDTSATSNSATDRLLAFVDSHSGLPLAQLTDQGPPLTDRLIASLVERGVWRRRADGRLVDTDEVSRVGSARAEAYRIVTKDGPAGPFDTCLAVLLYPSRRMPAGVLARCGAAADFLTDYVDRHGSDRIRAADLLQLLDAIYPTA